VEAKQCGGPDGAETFLLVRSVERREKERAMHQRFTARIEVGLTRLAHRLPPARPPLARRPVERQLRRLLGRNPRGGPRLSRPPRGTVRARSSRNSVASTAPTSCSPRPTAATCACGA